MGKTNVSYIRDGLNEYFSRLTHYCKLNWVELPDVKSGSKMTPKALMEHEGELFLKHIDKRARVVILDETGQQFTSRQFAEFIEKHMIYETRPMYLLIGGAYGVSSTLRKRAEVFISLSKLTFNHQLVRLILAEQLYRAFTIVKGEPYHHD
ncbi:MAG: 23S rRNA (pseudouridine(1915)-N(3))-methyltransferase RlmH [Salibacteraceae bacterium]